ncbi:MAG TPA: tripartite tricarboxylate transporter permease [Kiloniellaceae bacterium]|nr:tripartite tricarboxylate transporter permease [Kiloniellaceae bacterium]
MVRGTAIGSLLGLLPGGGAMISSFASYAVEKRLAKKPEEFGRGAIAGLAEPEAANNAGAQTSFIPMLTLGVPSNGVMALMIGALMVHNIAPGPYVMVSHPEVFWGVIASMWIGNALLVVLNLPLVDAPSQRCANRNQARSLISAARLKRAGSRRRPPAAGACGSTGRVRAAVMMMVSACFVAAVRQNGVASPEQGQDEVGLRWCRAEARAVRQRQRASSKPERKAPRLSPSASQR